MKKKDFGEVLLTIGLIFLILAIVLIILEFPVTYRMSRWTLLTKHFNDYIRDPLIGSVIGIICILIGKRLTEK